HSPDAEQGLLCSLLRAPGPVATLCKDRINYKTFFIPAHGIIYEAILAWPKPDQPVDHIWLERELQCQNQIDEAGGREALASLYDFVPTHENADFYIKLILQEYGRRTAIQLGDQLSALCQDDHEDLPATLTRFEKQLSQLRHA